MGGDNTVCTETYRQVQAAICTLWPSGARSYRGLFQIQGQIYDSRDSGIHIQVFEVFTLQDKNSFDFFLTVGLYDRWPVM